MYLSTPRPGFLLYILYRLMTNNKQNFSWVIFDVGNVILLGDETLGCEALHRCGVPLENTEKIYSCNEYYDFCRGTITPEKFADLLVIRYLKIPLTCDQIKRAFKETCFGVDHEVVKVLSRLDRKGLALLTDTNVWQEEKLAEMIDLGQFTDKWFRSYETHLVKTDKNCFPYVIEQLESDPGRLLLVDDSPEKREMAEQHGLKTFPFSRFPNTNTEQLVSYLWENGLLIA